MAEPDASGRDMRKRLWVMLGISGAMALAVVAVSTARIIRADGWQLDRQARTITASGSTTVISLPLVWVGRRFDISGLGIMTIHRPVDGPLPANLVARLQLAVAETGGIWMGANALRNRGAGFSGPAYLIVVEVEHVGKTLYYSASFTSNAELISFVIIPQAGSGP